MAIRKPKKVIRFATKVCAFCKDKTTIDYKDSEGLNWFINIKGRITSRRVNGNCAKHQRQLAREVKRARFLALLSYVSK